MSASDFAALRAWLDFDEQNLPHGDSLRDISYGGAPISRANLRAALDDYETELEAAYRKGWTDCGIHARRETDSLLDEMARDFTETGRAKREFMRRQIAALGARDAKAGEQR